MVIIMVITVKIVVVEKVMVVGILQSFLWLSMSLQTVKMLIRIE